VETILSLFFSEKPNVFQPANFDTITSRPLDRYENLLGPNNFIFPVTVFPLNAACFFRHTMPLCAIL
jgi:hypothetical protein